jgi:hypothetical protein
MKNNVTKEYIVQTLQSEIRLGENCINKNEEDYKDLSKDFKQRLDIFKKLSVLKAKQEGDKKVLEFLLKAME